MESGFCIDCKTETDWVTDYHQGDTICRECGLVLDCRYVQDNPEWRIFDDDDKGADPTRVGQPSDPLTGEPTATRISSANCKNKKNADQLSVPKKFEAPSAKEKNLKEAYTKIDQMAEMLGIVKSIVDEAKLFYQQAYDENLCQGKKSDKLTAMAATCLVLACQSNGQNGARTIKEIRRVSNGCSKHDINNMKILLQEKLSVKAKTVTAADLATRCCSKLGMSHDQKRAVLEALPNAEQMIVRSSTPAAVLAAVVYMISQHSDRKLTIREVREAAVIGDYAAKATYKEISAKASMIVPDWFRVKFSGPQQICTPSI